MDRVPNLSIVVVNWNSGHRLSACLASIQACNQDGFRLDRVIVVDNASTDGSERGIEAANIPILFLSHPTNLGFAVACNRGAAEGRADYPLFLNPDTRLSPSSLTVPIRYLQNPKNARVGICGIQLVDSEGRISRTCARLPSPRSLLARATGLGKMVPRWLPLARMTEWSHDSDRNVGQVMGAFFLVRGSLCVALDGFDERFFLYFEEVDFSLREAQRGWTSAYLVGASAYHEGGGAFRAALSLRLYHSIRSRILFARKHFARHEAALVLATTLLVEPIARTVRSFAMLSIGRLVLELAAFARFAYGIPALLRVRRVP